MWYLVIQDILIMLKGRQQVNSSSSDKSQVRCLGFLTKGSQTEQVRLYWVSQGKELETLYEVTQLILPLMLNWLSLFIMNLFNSSYNFDESEYCQSVLDACTVDNNKRYVLSDVNVTKLLHDHGADVNEWQEDSKRYNDPEEILMWLGY